jgi:aldehyde:ferredoxin oxidoreductase
VDFYKGKVLRIDLSRKTATTELLNMDWAALYVGGKGLLLRYLWDETEPKADPWAPDNPLVLMSGPFAGTGVPTASRLVVGGKSPATGILNDSYVGGSFAPEMKFAGYDAIIVVGRAPQPSVVTVCDDVIEFLPGEPKYWGLKTSEIEQAMRRDFNSEAKTLSIGPAGEALIPWACLSTDHYHKAGRGGHGALMGSKNLKAISVRGTGGVTVGSVKAFMADMERIHRESVLTEDNLWTYEEGTPVLVDLVNGAGAMPTRNWSEGYFEGARNLNSESFQAIRVKKRACYQCSLACRNVHATTWQGAKLHGEGPEYETIALCGANCGIDEIGALVKFNEQCDEWGLDTISSGSVVGLAMDLTERGVHDFGIRFGQADGYVRMPGLIARRIGVGSELAKGVRELCIQYGVPELGMEVKNLEIPGYDPRGSFGMSIAYATSDRGGCHMRTFPAGSEIVSGAVPADTLKGKVEAVIRNRPPAFNSQDFSSIKYCGILCEFWAITPVQLSHLFEHLYNRELSEDEVMLMGERVWNLARLFNLREGVEPDALPEKLYSERYAHQGGPSAGRAIGDATWAQSLRLYYELRGWDAHGVPTEPKLRELRVDVRL